MKSDRGAPAALKAVEEHELICRQEKDAARKERDKALAKLVDDDDVSERTYRRAVTAYSDALANWDEALKRLNTFDKSVVAERREGEKIPTAEVKEMVAQLILSMRQALEDYIITQSQAAALCSSPEEFHLAHASNLRSRLDAALAKARADGVLPEWATLNEWL